MYFFSYVLSDNTKNTEQVRMPHIKFEKYRIALNFWEPKFLRIAIFEDFVEIILQIRCMRTLHTVCHKFSLKYFCEWLKIRKTHEIKDPRKFCAQTPLFASKKFYTLPSYAFAE